MATPADPRDDTHHHDVEFIGLELSDDELAGRSFERCTFTRCELAGASLVGSELDGCTVVGSNLTLVQLADARVASTTFIETKLSGVDWTVAKVGRLRSPLTFGNCRLDDSSFMGMRLSNWSFAGSTLSGADLSDADLTGASFDGAMLRGTRFGGARLHGVSFVDADELDIDLRTADLQATAMSPGTALALVQVLGVELQPSRIEGDGY